MASKPRLGRAQRAARRAYFEGLRAHEASVRDVVRRNLRQGLNNLKPDRYRSINMDLANPSSYLRNLYDPAYSTDHDTYRGFSGPEKEHLRQDAGATEQKRILRTYRK